MHSQPLSAQEIDQALESLPGWGGGPAGLEKAFKFGSFREAMSFMVRAAFEAEALNHHPDWSNVYDRVNVRLNTHAAGGKVTAADVELARRIERINWAG